MLLAVFIRLLLHVKVTLHKARLVEQMVRPLTTENSIFVVCHKHTVKSKKHSAKDLPSVTLDKQHIAWLVKVDEAGAFPWKNTTLIRQESDWTVKSEMFHGQPCRFQGRQEVTTP